MKSFTLNKPALAVLAASMSVAAFTPTVWAEEEKPHAIQTLYVDEPEAISNEYKDLDQDGVQDNLDHCPNSVLGMPVNTYGCELDSDGDGVYDRNDDCPNTPKGAVVNERGCELDEDGDGVVDRLDICPGTPSIFKVTPDGCPILVLDHALFDFDQAQLNERDLGKLQTNVATLPPLKTNEAILVTGHTDNKGSESYNMNLSWERAASVKNFMVSDMNYDEEVIWINGMGESSPVVENDTEENRHKNRRVEVRVIPKDALPDQASTSIE